jgi:ribosomal protein S10
MKPNAQTDSALDETDPFYGADAVEDTQDEVDRGDTVTLEEEDQEEVVVEPVTEVEETEEEVVAGAEEAVVTETEEVVEEAAEEVVEEVVEAAETTGAEAAEETIAPTTERRSTTIPRPRFDQVNNKLKEANQRIAELVEKQTSTATATAEQTQSDVEYQAQVVADQQAINDLVLDGDTVGAAQKQAELTTRMTTRVLESAREQAKAEVSETFAQQAYDKTLTSVENDFPFINPDKTDSYDEGMVTRVRTITQSLMASEGYTAADALQEATETVAARFYPELMNTEAGEIVEDTSDADAAALAAQKSAATRSTVTKKIAAAAKQPAKLGGESTATGNDALPNVFDMSEAEFGELSSVELARLRGDVL